MSETPSGVVGGATSQRYVYSFLKSEFIITFNTRAPKRTCSQVCEDEKKQCRPYGTQTPQRSAIRHHVKEHVRLIWQR